MDYARGIHSIISGRFIPQVRNAQRDIETDFERAACGRSKEKMIDTRAGPIS